MSAGKPRAGLAEGERLGIRDEVDFLSLADVATDVRSARIKAAERAAPRPMAAVDSQAATRFPGCNYARCEIHRRLHSSIASCGAGGVPRRAAPARGRAGPCFRSSDHGAVVIDI